MCIVLSGIERLVNSFVITAEMECCSLQKERLLTLEYIDVPLLMYGFTFHKFVIV